jgi:RHS repeat-associated protein
VRRITAAEVTDPTGATRVVSLADGRWTSDGYAGSTVTAERDGATGFITGLVYPDGSRTDYAYDRAGHVIAVTEAAAEQRLSTEYGYDPAWHEVTSMVDPAGLETTYTYDQAGNLAAVTEPGGATTRYEYDPRGRLATLTTPDGSITRVGYELNHRITVTDPEGLASSEYYDAAGRLAAVTDPLGNTTKLGYDRRDQVVSVTDPGGGETSFEYDGAGNLTALTDAAGNPTRYAYDELGRMISRTDPLGAVDSYRYDEAGRLVEHVDRRGIRTTYAYDELGQPTVVSYGVDDGGEAESTVNYRYDDLGQLVEVDDTAYGSIRYQYDPLGRMVAETTAAGTVAYRYDEAGQRTSVLLPDGTETSYTYDDAGRLTGVSNQDATVQATRDQAGRVTGLELPNGITAEYGYDQRGQLTGVAYRHGGTNLGDLSYEYDPAGRRSAVSGSLAGLQLPDPVDQAAYDAGNRLVQYGDTPLVYDPAGNLVDDGSNTYMWDVRGQLVAVDGLMQATFAYDPFGRRVEKTIDGNSTRYLYDGDNLAQQTEPDGTVGTYLTGPGLDEHYAATRNGVTETYLTDVQGTVIGLAGPGGILTGTYIYTPHGATTGDEPSPFGFTGRELDETGLYYHRARYYHPQLGRFISEDPLGYGAGDPNLYAHTFGDPVNYTDPTGLQATAGAGIWVCAAASGWALVESNKNIAGYHEVLETTPPLSDEQFIALDELVVRQWNLIDIWMTICSIALGIPGFGGLGAPAIGGFGRGLPALTSRFPQLFGRLPSVRPTPAQLRGPGAVPRPPTTTRPPTRGSCSFDGDTPVLLADGTTVAIRDIRPGDLVLATDPVTGDHGPREVTHTWVHEDDLVDLGLDSGHVVTTTEDHPFWNHTDRQWQPAAAIEPGDQLVTSTGDSATVTGLDAGSVRSDLAYNLTIDGIHTYYVLVGDTSVLVHNTCPEVPFGPRMNYEPNPKHAGGRLGNYRSPEPTNSQAMLDRSFLVNSASGRRVAYDPDTGEIIMFARHHNASYHGYVSTWTNLPREAQNVLIRQGIFKPNGKLR